MYVDWEHSRCGQCSRRYMCTYFIWTTSVGSPVPFMMSACGEKLLASSFRSMKLSERFESIKRDSISGTYSWGCFLSNGHVCTVHGGSHLAAEIFPSSKALKFTPDSGVSEPEFYFAEDLKSERHKTILVQPIWNRPPSKNTGGTETQSSQRANLAAESSCWTTPGCKLSSFWTLS